MIPSRNNTLQRLTSYTDNRMSWRGKYKYEGAWYEMTFVSARIELQARGVIDCAGFDEVGQFTLCGGFINGSNLFAFRKQYYEQHTIFYQGEADPANSNELVGFWGYAPGKKYDQFTLSKI